MHIQRCTVIQWTKCALITFYQSEKAEAEGQYVHIYWASGSGLKGERPIVLL